MSIKLKLIIAFSITAALPLFVISILTINQIEESAYENFKAQTLKEFQQVDNGFSLFFGEIEKSVNFIAEHTLTQKAVRNLTSYNTPGVSKIIAPEVGGAETELFELFDAYAKAHKPEYIYIGSKEGGYIQWPATTAGEYYNPTVRPWFTAGKQSGTQVIRPPVYYFAHDDISIASSVRAIRSNSGEFLGTIGIDVSLDGLTKIVDNIRIGETGHMLLIEGDNVIADPKTPENNFKKTVDVHPQLIELMKNSNDRFEVTYQNKTFLAQHYHSSRLGWDFIAIIDKAEVLDKVQTVTSIIVIIGLILLLAVVACAIFIAQLIASPILNVSQGLEAISKGGGDLTQRLTIKTKDETGHLAESFNQFLGSINNLVKEINGSASSVSQASGQTQNISEELNSNIQQQQNALEQTATAIHQMAMAANEVAQNCSGAAEQANQSKLAAETGQQVILQTVDKVNELGEAVSSAVEHIRQLDMESDNITSILDVIRGIAEQTNLLALNAAIEAARAGSHGRGFAVVADEVRALSQRTSESTEEIASQLGKLRTMTQSVSNNMEKGLETSTEAVSSTHSAQEAFSTVHAAVEEISEMNIQIATASEEQQQVAEDISKNVEAIKQAVDRISGVSTDASENSSHLNQLSSSLTTLVKQFKIN